MDLTPADYKRALAALLPVGAAWPREAGTVWDALLGALALEFSRAGAVLESLPDEALPETATALLVDWERAAGLEAVGTQQERRAALKGWLNAKGGVSTTYFIALASDSGVAITITRTAPFQVGRSTAGESLYNGDWLYTWQVNGPAATGAEVRAALQSLFLKEKPAHSIAIFLWS